MNFAKTSQLLIVTLSLLVGSAAFACESNECTGEVTLSKENYQTISVTNNACGAKLHWYNKKITVSVFAIGEVARDRGLELKAGSNYEVCFTTGSADNSIHFTNIQSLN